MKKPILIALSFLMILAAVQSVSAISFQSKLTEEQKITLLINYVRKLDGAIFIRNGSEYPAQRAADHLQMKREKAGSKIKTARDFIKYLASNSSFSGEPYQIRFKNGKTYNSGDVLVKELKRIETSN